MAAFSKRLQHSYSLILQTETPFRLWNQHFEERCGFCQTVDVSILLAIQLTAPQILHQRHQPYIPNPFNFILCWLSTSNIQNWPFVDQNLIIDAPMTVKGTEMSYSCWVALIKHFRLWAGYIYNHWEQSFRIQALNLTPLVWGERLNGAKKKKKRSCWLIAFLLDGHELYCNATFKIQPGRRIQQIQPTQHTAPDNSPTAAGLS